MARFEIHELEGMRYVDIHLNHEMVRVESGALSYLTGNIAVHSQLVPSVGGLLKSLLADEAVYRPTYTGTEVITLESSLGGFHLLDLKGETWILEKGAFWACDGRIDLSFHRERMMTGLWAGEGLVYLQTRVGGDGQAVVTTRGPVEEIILTEGQEIAAEGQYVICRTADVGFEVRRPTKNFWGRFTWGEQFVRVYNSPGQVLLNPTPCWRYKMFASRSNHFDLPSRAME